MIKLNCLILQKGKLAQRGTGTAPWSHSKFKPGWIWISAPIHPVRPPPPPQSVLSVQKHCAGAVIEPSVDWSWAGGGETEGSPVPVCLPVELSWAEAEWSVQSTDLGQENSCSRKGVASGLGSGDWTQAAFLLGRVTHWTGMP